jgi:hypothetical protein
MNDDKERLKEFHDRVRLCTEASWLFYETSPIYKESLVMCTLYGGQCMIDKCMPNKTGDEEGGTGV